MMNQSEFNALSRSTGRSDEWLADNIGMCNIASWRRWCGKRPQDEKRTQHVYLPAAYAIARLTAYAAGHAVLLQSLPPRPPKNK